TGDGQRNSWDSGGQAFASWFAGDRTTRRCWRQRAITDLTDIRRGLDGSAEAKPAGDQIDAAEDEAFDLGHGGDKDTADHGERREHQEQRRIGLASGDAA